MGGGKEERQPRKTYYYNWGGWGGYTWGWVDRIRFVFSDSLQVGGSLVHADDGEGWIEETLTAAGLAGELPNKYFAGIACVSN